MEQRSLEYEMANHENDHSDHHRKRPPRSSYLDLGAVVRLLRRQQAGEAGLLRLLLLLLLLLAGPVAVHAAGVGVEEPPPPVAVQRHVHRRVFVVARLRRHVGVGEPWPDRRRRRRIKELTSCK